MAHQQQAYGQQRYGPPPVTKQPQNQQLTTPANDMTSNIVVGCSKLLAALCFPCGEYYSLSSI